MIEERLEGPRLQTFDVFSVASETCQQALGLFRAVAYVDVNARGNLMQFAETVAVNRGVPLKVFDTVGEAEAWLMVDAGGQPGPAAEHHTPENL